MTHPTSAAVRARLDARAEAEAHRNSQEQAKGQREGMRALSYVLAGPLCYGGIGWLIDHFIVHSGFLLPIGVVVGLALSIFMIIRRYGSSA